ncbi:hypothetical protein OOZ63_10355 [Paucibacter sp. PLA-PC-4]|uniref:hypothetical protein n=1 Tax=Paucibacter sp. PLA-PC-4 TaxID=2993655 RepID=UPI002249111B|nr:hypothetical protein [Paucibacter sp. PLA-PC-4]MCX2862244.1 hypothetical protein [Paucibacter sp. PLA-PC-4]
MSIYLSVGIVLAFAFSNRREVLGGLPASPHDDGSDSLLWFAMCAGFWPLMLVSAFYTKTRKSQHKHR